VVGLIYAAGSAFTLRTGISGCCRVALSGILFVNLFLADVLRITAELATVPELILELPIYGRQTQKSNDHPANHFRKTVGNVAAD